MRAFILSIILTLSMATSVLAKPPASAFGQIPRVHDASVSPDGTRLALFLRVKDDYGVAVVALEDSGGRSYAMGMESGVKPEWIQWANNDIFLVSTWESNKVRGTPITTGHLYAFNTHTQDLSVLARPKNGQQRQYNNNVIDFLPNEEDYILMAFSDLDARAPDVQKLNIRNGRYTKIKNGSRKIQHWKTDLRGEVRVGQGRSDSGDGDWKLEIRDAEGRTWRSEKDYPGISADTPIFGFTGNPNEMIIGDYKDKDTLGLYIYDLTQKRNTRKLFHNENYDAGGVILNSDGTDVIGASYIADSPQVELFDYKDSILNYVRNENPDHTIDFLDSSDGYRKVIMRISSESDSGGIFTFDTHTKELIQNIPLYDNLPVEDMGSVITAQYTTRDGQKIPAYLTLPPNVTDTPKDMPFIVLPHGGPYTRDYKRFDYFAQYFASRGYGVLQMNFRGSSGFGRSFQSAGRSNWVVMQEDVEDGARWLIEKGYADPERMCIAGWSYGGYAALISKIKSPDLFKCASSVAGVTDLKGLRTDMRKYRFGRVTADGFLGFDNEEAMIENSPMRRAEEMSGHVFLAHGTKDERVHFDHFKKMKSALKDSDAAVTALEFKYDDHFLSIEKNRKKLFEELDEFLEDAVGVSEFAE